MVRRIFFVRSISYPQIWLRVIYSRKFVGLILVSVLAGALHLGAQGPPPSHTATPEQRFHVAVEAQQQGRTAQAIQLYQALLRTQPDALVVRINLAGLLVESGRFAEAIDLYRAGLRLTPSSKDLQYGLTYAFVRQGTPAGLDLAAKALELMHSGNSADEKVSMLLAESEVRRARYADALPLLAPLEQAHPDDNDVAWLTGSALIGVGRIAEGLKRIDALAVKAGSADAYLLAGQTRLNLQQFDLAKADAAAALAHQPDLPGAQTLLGRALEHLGDYDASLASLRKAVAADDTDYEAHFYLGAVLFFQRDLPAAEQQLRRALALKPSAVEARYKLVLVEQAQGRSEDALHDLQTVISERPQWLEPQTTLVALLYKLHRNEQAAIAKAAADKLSATQQPGAPAGASP